MTVRGRSGARPEQVRFDFCQRWTNGRESYRPAGETITVREFGVDIISDADSKDFVARHHYAPNSPPQILSVGLFRRKGVQASELVGVCRFSVPMNQAAVPKHTGQDAAHGCELGRLVLLEEVAANGESYFVSRALRALSEEKPHMRAVVSYCDPVPRYRKDGSEFKRGHIGTCYQALNARHVGRAKARTLTMTNDGDVISERTLSKFRRDERGAEYAYRQLLQAGCPKRKPGEDRGEYLVRAVKEGGLRKLKHPGNLVYTWAIGSPAERRARRLMLPDAIPYPKLHCAA
jgi:hypothetical protein